MTEPERGDLRKNNMIAIDWDVLGEINYRLDSANGSGPFDESFFMTQAEIDERARKEVNALLHQALASNYVPMPLGAVVFNATERH
jgi:hypothetical protein